MEEDRKEPYSDILFEVLSRAENMKECKGIPRDVLVENVYRLFESDDEFLDAFTRAAMDIADGDMTLDDAARELCRTVTRLIEIEKRG